MNKATNDIILRIPEPEDIDTLVQWENSTQVWHAGTTNIPYSRFAMEQFVMDAQHNAFDKKQVRFMIDLLSAQYHTIGTVDLFDINALHRRAAIGILIISEYRNKGYAKQALQKIEKYAFHDLWLQQIYARILEDNQTSIQLFTSEGFVQTGTKKAWIKTPNKYIDEIFMQKLNPAYHG